MRSREVVILVISLISLMLVAGQALPPPSKYKFPLHLTDDGSFYTLNVDVANNETFRLRIDTENYLLMLISNETCPSSFKGKCLETASDWRQNTGFKYCSNCTYFQQQYCRMGISKVRLELENGSYLENGEYFFCVANYLESKFGEWKGIDGTIGLINPVKDSEISSFYSLFPSSTKKMFALELYNDQPNNLAKDASVVGRSSTLSIGGYDFKSENESQLLRWSESGKWKEDYLNVFPFALYHLSICGIDLMEGISSEMTAVISTNVDCVHLPENLWKMVMSWIGARCDAELQYPPIQPRCNLTVEQGKLGELPPLIFKLSEFGEDLHLPLQLLLQPTSTNNTYNVCLKISEYGQIIIGTRILQNSFTTLFDLEQRKVGLIPIHNYTFQGKSTFSLCASPLTCSVTDTYDAQYNLCFPPNCSSYLFQVNGNHGDCVYSKMFVYPLLLVLFSFCSIEVVLAVIYRKMTDKMSIPFLHD